MTPQQFKIKRNRLIKLFGFFFSFFFLKMTFREFYIIIRVI